MENQINVVQSADTYLRYFQKAQYNLNQLIQEERQIRRMKKHKTESSKS
jgi:hypothetical protein